MKYIEKIVEGSLLITALSSILIILLILLFIVNEGLPILNKVGVVEFVTGSVWEPADVGGTYGIFPMIAGTLAITALSLILGLPLGLGCAILLSEVAPPWSRDILKPAIETLAGIPSVVYGFFGLILIVPFIMNNLGGGGLSVLACGIVLAIMILPTIISISEDALRSVPREYREGALAIGATKWQMIVGIVVPAARSGILASAILGMGRAIGETMAVWMVSGNTRLVPTSLLSSVAPMSSQIALEWNYASGDHRTALFAIGIVLLAIIMLLNLIVYLTSKERLVERI